MAANFAAGRFIDAVRIKFWNDIVREIVIAAPRQVNPANNIALLKNHAAATQRGLDKNVPKVSSRLP